MSYKLIAANIGDEDLGDVEDGVVAAHIHVCLQSRTALSG